VALVQEVATQVLRVEMAVSLAQRHDQGVLAEHAERSMERRQSFHCSERRGMC
jgi:hypothetical protein